MEADVAPGENEFDAPALVEVMTHKKRNQIIETL